MQAVFKLIQVQSSNIFAMNSHVSDLTDMAALDNRIFVLHSQLSQSVAKFVSELKLPQLIPHMQYILAIARSYIDTLSVGPCRCQLMLCRNCLSICCSIFPEQITIIHNLFNTICTIMFTKARQFSLFCEKSMQSRPSNSLLQDPNT